MAHKNYCLVSGIFFALVALLHLFRVIDGTSVQVDAYLVPVWVSWIGMVVPAALAFWAFRTAGQAA